MAMQPLEWFAVLQLMALLLAAPIASQPELQEYKPAAITDRPERDTFNILSLVVVGTAFLVVLKLLGISLRFLVDLAVFVSGLYFAALIRLPALGIPAGIALLLVRRWDNVTLFNLTTAISVVTFSTLFAAFLPPETVLLLLGAMSLYDAIAVFYTKHMKFLWFRQKLDSFRRSLVFLFPTGDRFSVIGAGDFSLPLLFTISVARNGLWQGALAGTAAVLGFSVMQHVSERTWKTEETGVPGIPFIAVFCALSALLLSAARPV